MLNEEQLSDNIQQKKQKKNKEINTLPLKDH